MRNSRLLISAFCLAAAIFSCNQSQEYAWEENFDGPEIDWGTWSKVRRGGAPWQRYMSDRDDLFDIQDGCLVLRGIANPEYGKFCSGTSEPGDRTGVPADTVEFLTGGVTSFGKKGFGYGRLDIRARMKDVTGSWPAIWLMPNDTSSWPYGGEIDIMERLNHDDFAYQTVHTSYTLEGHGGTFQQHGGTAPMTPGEFNIYSFEHYPDSLILSINGVRGLKYIKEPAAPEEQWPFDREYHFILSMQLNTEWCGPTDLNELPDEMYIDWIRFTPF